MFPSLTRARYLVAAIASVIESIRLTDGHCPTVSATRGYIGPHALLDPWGTTVIYQCTPEGDIVVRSAGPDVFFGTEDDITNDEPERIPDPKAARRLTAKVANAVQSFRNTEQRCPTPDQLVSHNYVVAPTLVDPWGTSITISCTPGGDVVVRSAGPDRLLHTCDDITND